MMTIKLIIDIIIIIIIPDPTSNPPMGSNYSWHSPLVVDDVTNATLLIDDIIIIFDLPQRMMILLLTYPTMIHNVPNYHFWPTLLAYQVITIKLVIDDVIIIIDLPQGIMTSSSLLTHSNEWWRHETFLMWKNVTDRSKLLDISMSRSHTPSRYFPSPAFSCRKLWASFAQLNDNYAAQISQSTQNWKWTSRKKRFLTRKRCIQRKLLDAQYSLV